MACGETEAEARAKTTALVRRVIADLFAFHDGIEVGPRMLARIARHTGPTPDDL